MLRGTVVKHGTDWFVETRESDLSEPFMIIRRWKVAETRLWNGNYVPAPAIEEGAEVTYRSGGGHWQRWQLCRDGSYLCMYTDEYAEQSTEPIPRPRTKLRTRYYYGQWQKYTKREGWVRA